MKRVLEPLVFLGLASALHAAVWVGAGAGGAPGAGDGGEAALSLEAGGAEVAALVRRWQTPPEYAASPAAALGASPAAAPAAMAAPAMPEAPELPRPLALPAPAVGPDFGSPQPDRAPDPGIATLAQPPEIPRPERRPGPLQPPQQAAGAGAGAASGASGPATASSPAPGRMRALEAEWGAAILARIARQQRYPSGSRDEGTVRVTLTVARDGRLREVALAGTSGSAALDRAALEAVRRAGRFPAAPPALDGGSYIFRVPMTFRRD